MALINQTMGVLIISFGIYGGLILFSLIRFSALSFLGYDTRVSSLTGFNSEEYSLAFVKASEQVVAPPIHGPYKVIPYTFLLFPWVSLFTIIMIPPGHSWYWSYMFFWWNIGVPRNFRGGFHRFLIPTLSRLHWVDGYVHCFFVCVSWSGRETDSLILRWILFEGF